MDDPLPPDVLGVAVVHQDPKLVPLAGLEADPLDLAGHVVDRRFGAEKQDFCADQIGGDRGADIDGVEKAVAGRMGDDGKGQLAVGRMEILRSGILLGGLLEGVAADRLVERARLREGARYGQRYRRGERRERKQMFH